MVHLFCADSLDIQFDLLQTARKHIEAGGERMRYTFPALITSSIKLCRRYKNCEHLEEGWQDKVNAILKFPRQCPSILATQVDAPALALRLFLLAAQITSECGCGFEDFSYDFYVQAFSVYEDSISESRAQLAAITLIIGTLQGARIVEETTPGDGGAASHLWWQEPVLEEGEADGPAVKESEKAAFPPREDGEGAKAYPHQDSKRVLECLQKSLRIANSATGEIVTVQLYCDTLDQYLYYFDRGAPAIAPKFIVSLVELIASSIDTITSPSSSSSYLHPSQRIEGVATPEVITRHFRNTLAYIHAKKTAENPGQWDEVEVVGAFLKMGITR
ncbi:Vps35-domain-containing protein [Suillus brevipes Sb2]|nr:Vps35-domain-containing protein [Suillus brevipes Sb2]